MVISISICVPSSCSHLLDSTVAVWDVRRPFIQFATFTEHTDVVTGKVCT